MDYINRIFFVIICYTIHVTCLYRFCYSVFQATNLFVCLFFFDLKKTLFRSRLNAKILVNNASAKFYATTLLLLLLLTIFFCGFVCSLNCMSVCMRSRTKCSINKSSLFAKISYPKSKYIFIIHTLMHILLWFRDERHHESYSFRKWNIKHILWLPFSVIFLQPPKIWMCRFDFILIRHF